MFPFSYFLPPFSPELSPHPPQSNSIRSPPLPWPWAPRLQRAAFSTRDSSCACLPLEAPPLHKDSVGTVLVRPHPPHPYLSPASWSLILLNHSLAVQRQLKHYLVLLYIVHRCRFSHQQTCLVPQNLGADSSPTVQTCRRQGGHNRLRCCFLWLSHVPNAMFLFRRHFLPLVASETALRRIQNCSLGDFPILF